MDIILTGASGYIGRQFNGCKSVDLRKQKIDSVTRPTCIIHLAGLAHKSFSEQQYYDVNVKLTSEMAKQAYQAGIQRIVFLSSSNVKDDYAFVHSLSGKSKWLAEFELKKIAKEYGLELVIIRSPMVYGPDAPGNFSKMVKLLSKLSILPFGSLTSPFRCVSINNLVDLIKICAVHPNAPGNIFYPSDSDVVSLRSFTNLMALQMGKKLFQLSIPYDVLRFILTILGKRSLGDNLLAINDECSNNYSTLNWSPKYSVEESLKFLSVYKNDTIFRFNIVHFWRDFFFSNFNFDIYYWTI